MSQLNDGKSVEIFVKEFIFEDLVEDDPMLLQDIPTPGDIKDTMQIIDDLDGDSLMMITLLKSITKQYGIELDLDDLGRKLMHRPADTVGEIVDMARDLVVNGPAAFQ